MDNKHNIKSNYEREWNTYKVIKLNKVRRIKNNNKREKCENT